ncbi:MAG: hypothetical protein HY903_14570 [Deltaproteobacteria bacterium]|nr:hypothetical protein [Deltaproteobacteria bacterium]
MTTSATGGVKRAALIHPAIRHDVGRLNPLLKKAGIKTIAEFSRRLEAYLHTYPEMERLASAARRFGAKAVFSGGTARALVSDFIKNAVAAAEGKPVAAGPRSLLAILEGQDIDALVMGVKGRLPPDAVRAMTAELNRESCATLVDPLPSIEKRYYAVDWDLSDAVEFARLNRIYGGETPSQLGIGLGPNGRLQLYDPVGAFEDLFRGAFNYAPGDGKYDEQMVVSGKMDPSLDGLRIIRVIGAMREVGVRPSAQALSTLTELGDDAKRRRWEIQARFLHSPDGKLERRWVKYVKRLFNDFRDPRDAIRLLDQSGYADVLTSLGLKRYLLDSLPAAVPPPSAKASAECNRWIAAHQTTFAPHVTSQVPSTFLWVSKKMADGLTKGLAVFGQRAGELGPGLYLSGRALPEGAASKLVSAQLTPDGRFLDLTRLEAKALVDRYLEKFGSEFAPATNGDVPQLGARADARSAAIGHLLAGLGLDGAVDANAAGVGTAVVTNTRVLIGFAAVSGIEAELTEQLHLGGLGARTENGVRALLALKRQQGLAELGALLRQGKVTPQQVLPAAGGETLFELLPFVDPAVAAELQAAMARAGAELTPAQREAGARAVVYLRGDLPERCLARGTETGSRMPDRDNNVTPVPGA